MYALSIELQFLEVRRDTATRKLAWCEHGAEWRGWKEVQWLVSHLLFHSYFAVIINVPILLTDVKRDEINK
jgi:hypothetical protein